MTYLKNSIAALAVCLPLVAAAQAPAAAEPAKTPLYTIYGTLNINAHWSMAKGATSSAQTVQSRWAVSPDSSNIGIRGAAEIAPGYQVVYQCETGANLDAGSTFLCNRNSRLGVSGFWGTLFYGNWDTPYKAATYGTKADDPFGNTDVFGYNAIMGSPGFNVTTGTWTSAVPADVSATANATIRGFDLRANNSIAYWTPKFMGASLKAQWSVNEGKGRGPDNTFVQSPNLYSAALNYDFGPLSVVAAVDLHEDGYGLYGINSGTVVSTVNPAHAFGVTGNNLKTTSSTDYAWRVGAGYELATGFGTTTISALYEDLTLSQSHVTGNALREFNRTAIQGGLKHRVGSHEFRARYSYADAGDCKVATGSCNDAGYGAQDIALGYAYHFTKAMQGYLYWTRIENERNAQYTFTVGGSPVITGATPQGADPQAAGAGLRYAF